MNYKLIIIGILLLSISGLASGKNVHGWGTHHGDNKPTEKACSKASTLKEYARLVDDMICKQDDVDKDKILAFPDVNNKEEKCINHKANLGSELYDNEIMHCYKKND